MRYRIIFCLVAIALLVGTVSADTLILYIDDTNQDGIIVRTVTGTWQQIRDGAGSTVQKTLTGSIGAPQIVTGTTDGVYIEMYRGGFIFNTSKLDDGVIIDSAVLSIRGVSQTNGLGEPTLGLTLFSPASNTTIALGDYSNFSNSRIANDTNYASWAAAYNNITLTNTSAIDTTGFFRVMVRDKWDIDNNSSGLVWGNSKTSRFTWYETSRTGTASDPFITITYHAAGGSPPVASFTLNKNFLRIPNSVTATDTSTNTPTSWEWSWGDGTANNTTQNPTHQYLKRGKFDIYLTATNAGGSGSTGATSVKVVGYENY